MKAFATKRQGVTCMAPNTKKTRVGQVTASRSSLEHTMMFAYEPLESMDFNGQSLTWCQQPILVAMI